MIIKNITKSIALTLTIFGLVIHLCRYFLKVEFAKVLNSNDEMWIDSIVWNTVALFLWFSL